MNIKNLRKSRKLTQEDIAKAADVARSTVGMWETGKTNPKANTIPLLAELFGCSIDDLFAGEPGVTREEA